MASDPSSQFSARHPGEPVYTVIPLPARTLGTRKRQTIASNAAPLPPQGKTSQNRGLSPQRKRRRELLQAFGIAVGLNLLFILTLFAIAIRSDPFEARSLFVVTPVRDQDKLNGNREPQERASKPASAFPSSQTDQIKVQRSAPRAAIAPTALTHVERTNILSMSDPTFRISPSVSASVFADAAKQKREAIEQFVESEASQKPNWAQTGLEGTGIDEEVLPAIFHPETLGDGSSAVVYLDVSGSMKGISYAVEAYLNQQFPETQIRPVNGCSLRQISHPFPSSLLSDPQRNYRTDFYFICDLQDGESPRVISALRRFLSSAPVPRRIHIVSFDRPPNRHLSGLLSTPGSSLIMARGLVTKAAP